MPTTSTRNAPHYLWGNACDGWHLHKSNQLSVIEERMPPNTSETPHKHTKSTQFFYVLDGTATIDLDGQIHQVYAGEGISVEPMIMHQILNKSADDLRFLVVSSPPSHDDRIFQ